MITFVINLHPNIHSLTLAEPLLYDLRKDGKLHVIFDNINDISQRLEQATIEVKKRLDRSRYMQWQAIFLVDIDPYQSSPFKDSLSAKMLLIRKLFLENKLLPNKPSQLYLLATDHVNKDDAIPAIETSPAYRDSWELDTKGFILDDNNFFVSTNDIRILDNIWRSHIRIDNRTIVSEGFDRLPVELKEKVNEAIRKISAKVEEMLHPDRISFEDYALNDNINYVDVPLLNAIKKEFYNRLANIKKDPSRYHDFSPATTLRTSIAEHVGIYAIENKYTYRLLRIPMHYQHTEVFQRFLVKIGVLISLIANQEILVSSLPKERNHTVKMKLDERHIGKVMLASIEHMHNVERRLQNRLDNPLPFTLSFREGDNCGCTESLNVKQPEEIDFGFMRYNGDLKKWRNWNEKVAEDLREYRKQAQRKMQSCISQMYRHQSLVSDKEITNIHDTIEDLKLKKDDLQRQVKHEFLVNKADINWDAYRLETEVDLKPRLVCRPSSSELFYLVAFFTLVISVPFLKFFYPNEWGLEVFYYAGILVLALLMCTLAFFLAKRNWTRHVEEIMLDVSKNARDKRNAINEEFERQKAYLDSLCRLNVVRLNYEEALAVREKLNTENMLIDHHRQKLTAHRENATNLAVLLGSDADNVTAIPVDEREVTDPVVTKPIHQNNIYAPVAYIPKKNADTAHLPRRNFNVESPIGYFIEDIEFAKDNIYTNEGKF